MFGSLNVDTLNGASSLSSTLDPTSEHALSASLGTLGEDSISMSVSGLSSLLLGSIQNTTLGLSLSIDGYLGSLSKGSQTDKLSITVSESSTLTAIGKDDDAIANTMTLQSVSISGTLGGETVSETSIISNDLTVLSGGSVSKVDFRFCFPPSLPFPFHFSSFSSFSSLPFLKNANSNLLLVAPPLPRFPEHCQTWL